jgi:site-specific recombinase XerD
MRFMLEKSFNLMFFLKRRQNCTNTELYIYLRITVNGVSKELSVKRAWALERWNPRIGRTTGNKEDARSVNSFLETLNLKAHEARRSLIDENKEVTAAAVRNVLLGIDDERKILEIFQEHNDQVAALVGKEYSAGTLDLFKRSLIHARSFIEWKYKVSDMGIKKLDYEFISQFSFYLKSVRSNQHNTSVKYLTYFKKIVLICVKSGLLNKDPFSNFKLTKHEKDRESLNEGELKAISKKQFVSERLSQVRDIFLFSCYTGLAYADVQDLKISDIIDDIDDGRWISIKRKKTTTPSKIPLLPVPLRLITKYRNHIKCLATGNLLPTLSNQKMNAYLKEIGDVCGINKPLTFHIARHTFATTITLNNGVPMESVAKMLGHKSLRQTQHYAKLLDKRVGEDMQLLKSKLSALHQ